MEDKGKKTEEEPPPSGEKETTSPKPLTTFTRLPGSSEPQQQKPDSVNHCVLTATANQPAGIHGPEMKLGLDIDLNLEDKKLRRTMSNRNSAQKSRTRKLQYIRELEQKAEELEVENSVLRICIESERKLKERLEMENGVLKRNLHFIEETAKLSHALFELRQKAMMRMQLGEIHVSHQSIGVGTEEEKVGSSSNEGGSASAPEPVEEEEKGEIDPGLNFKSLTIDPPERLV